MRIDAKPGEIRQAVDASAAANITGQSVSVSIKDTIVGIIPKDVISPFLNANMLQIIFMSILLGIAAGAISGKLQVMGLYALVGMILTCTNVTGDAAVTLIAAKREKMVDLDVYRS